MKQLRKPFQIILNLITKKNHDNICDIKIGIHSLMSIGKKIHYDINHILDILVLISNFQLQSEA